MPNSMQRLLGIVAAVIGAPLILGLALAIRLDSAGPAIYRAPRVGRGGRPFTCYKLRTMRWEPRAPGAAVSAAADSRVTRLGAFLRRYRLDELPQLWNVARGEMLLVGPRPEDPRFVDLGDPLHRLVFTGMPGITGLTQLAYADEAAMIDQTDPERHYREVILPRKVLLDADYLRRRSMRLDLWILGQTILMTLGRRAPLESPEVNR